MKKPTYILLVINVVLVCLLVYLFRMQSKPSDTVPIVQRDTTVYNFNITNPTIYKTTTINDRFDSLIHDTLWLKEHCDSIAEDWSNERIYADTVKDDTNAFISYTAFLRFNQLDDINFQFINRKPTNIYTYEKERKLLLLGGAQVQKTAETYRLLPVIGLGYRDYYGFVGSNGTTHAVTLTRIINFKTKK